MEKLKFEILFEWYAFRMKFKKLIEFYKMWKKWCELADENYAKAIDRLRNEK